MLTQCRLYRETTGDEILMPKWKQPLRDWLLAAIRGEQA